MTALPTTLTLIENARDPRPCTEADVRISVEQWSFGPPELKALASLRAALARGEVDARQVTTEQVQQDSWLWVVFLLAFWVAVAVAIAYGWRAAVLAGGGMVLSALALSAVGTATTKATLLIRCTSVAQVQHVLDVVVGSREAQVQSIAWRAGREDVTEPWEADCVRRARSRAEAIAAAAGQRVERLVRCQELAPPASEPALPGVALAPVVRSARVSPGQALVEAAPLLREEGRGLVLEFELA